MQSIMISLFAVAVYAAEEQDSSYTRVILLILDQQSIV